MEFPNKDFHLFFMFLFGFILIELYNIYVTNIYNNMHKKFTKSQFSAISNELVKLAKEFTSKGYDCSISFAKASITIFVHDVNVCVCALTIFEERFVCMNDFKDFVEVAKRANVTLNGKYTKLMVEEYENNKYTSNDYINF